MSTKFSIQGDAVNRQGANLDNVASQFEQTGKKFTQSLGQLPGVWKGQAAVAFTGMQQKTEEGIAGCLKALRELQAKVAASGQTYNASHQEQASTIQSKSASLNFDR